MLMQFKFVKTLISKTITDEEKYDLLNKALDLDVDADSYEIEYEIGNKLDSVFTQLILDDSLYTGVSPYEFLDNWRQNLFLSSGSPDSLDRKLIEQEKDRQYSLFEKADKLDVIVGVASLFSKMDNAPYSQQVEEKDTEESKTVESAEVEIGVDSDIASQVQKELVSFYLDETIDLFDDSLSNEEKDERYRNPPFVSDIDRINFYRFSGTLLSLLYFLVATQATSFESVIEQAEAGWLRLAAATIENDLNNLS
jgi:hypothetical protein